MAGLNLPIAPVIDPANERRPIDLHIRIEIVAEIIPQEYEPDYKLACQFGGKLAEDKQLLNKVIPRGSNGLDTRIWNQPSKHLYVAYAVAERERVPQNDNARLGHT